VSSADETAFAVRDQVGAAASHGAERLFITSGDPDTFRRLGARFLGPEVEHVEQWTWS
jgi:hypothetical protein